MELVFDNKRVPTRREINADEDIAIVAVWVESIRSGLPTQILATCRLVNEEAAPFIAAKLRDIKPAKIHSRRIRVPRNVAHHLSHV